ncbi:Auxin-responsive protein [Heracleum sosnowskyi]|uniref:Auxin-responsive protein n=1 Tax=Heracleum sosnowskyi TaxID=360622 RepID=A0AAD8HYS1_9APIA|nr:Auxin-responsive protein [Heracleum sosnowskyi]
MKGFSRKSDMISEADREWDSEEDKLELRLGPPGEEDWAIKNYTAKRNDSSALVSLGYSSNMNNGSNKEFFKAEFQEDTWINENHHNFSSSYSENSNKQAVGNTTALSPWSTSSSSSQYKQSLPPAMGKESLQIKDYVSDKVMVKLQNAAKKGFSQSSADNTAVPNNSQKRIAPVVGWPPIRSFRKNRASGCGSKLPVQTEARNEVSTKIGSCKKQTQSSQKGFFVKINMDGVPIGRKVNLNAYDSYEKLSCAVDELFRGLLAAQTDPSDYSQEEDGEKSFTGLLDGSGEYTLVYEDNEGDRMLVGDVPWNMFVSTVKRLRVLKSSELSSLLYGSKQEK